MTEPAPIDNEQQLAERVIKALKSVYDPEIPANIFDLGLVYDIAQADDGVVHVTMTLTAPNCPVADGILREVKEKVAAVDGVPAAEVKLVFDPPWDKSMMSEAVKLELGLL